MDEPEFEKDENIIMSKLPLGRLIRTLHEKCNQCLTTSLQIRGREVKQLGDGVSIVFEQTYEYCPSCDLEFDIRDEKSKRKWKESYVTYQQRTRAIERDAKERRRGHKRDNRQGFKNVYK